MGQNSSFFHIQGYFVMTEEATGAKPREPKTLWRLVEARCDQITDAISAARLPFLLGLTWSFIWISALYVGEFGLYRNQ